MQEENQGRYASQKAKGRWKFKRCRPSTDASGYGFGKMEVTGEFNEAISAKNQRDGDVGIADCCREGIKGGSGRSPTIIQIKNFLPCLKILRQLSVISQRTVTALEVIERATSLWPLLLEDQLINCPV